MFWLHNLLPILYAWECSLRAVIDLECLTLNAENFGQFYFRTEVMSENLMSEFFVVQIFYRPKVFCST